MNKILLVSETVAKVVSEIQMESGGGGGSIFRGLTVHTLAIPNQCAIGYAFH